MNENGPQAHIGAIPAIGKGALRLATCVFATGAAPSLGVVSDDGKVIDVAAEARRQQRSLSFATDSALGLAMGGGAALAEVMALVEKARAEGVATADIAQVRLLSPIPRPLRNIFCVGWNYLDHFEEGKEMRADKGVDKIPDHPVFFSKATNVMNGPFDAIPHDAGNSNSTDWEAELAVVIGKRGRNITEEQAMDHIFGYSVFNDTSVREVQQKRHGGQWFKGKSLDGHGPMGPWIVTSDGIDLDQQRIICRVNGVEKQNASYRQMYFKIPRIIAELSRGMTLEPGDIISTGTPSGVGFGRKPPEFLQPGDVMESEVTGIGVIRNRIEAENCS